MSVQCIELLHRGARATGVGTGICTWAVQQMRDIFTVFTKNTTFFRSIQSNGPILASSVINFSASVGFLNDDLNFFGPSPVI